jgi:hypothetical protein
VRRVVAVAAISWLVVISGSAWSAPETDGKVATVVPTTDDECMAQLLEIGAFIETKKPVQAKLELAQPLGMRMQTECGNKQYDLAFKTYNEILKILALE